MTIKMSYKSSDYTRCEKCKHIDRENEKCKITNDNWLVSDRAGTCHQFEGVESVKVKCVRKHVNDKGITVGNIYDVLNEEDTVFEIRDDDCRRRNFYKWKFRVVKDEIENPIKPNHYQAGEFDVIAFCFKHNLDFASGNVVKYIVRTGKKDKSKELEDLLKAREYLERKIEWVKANV